jgi:branched-chain amino acid transport system permease protein
MAKRLRTAHVPLLTPAGEPIAEIAHPDLAPFWRRARRLSKNEEMWLAVIVLVGAATALSGSAYWAEFADTLVYFAILAIGLNVVLGLAGLLDFGHVAYFAVGAYAAAKIMIAHPNLDFMIVVLASAGIAGLAAFLMGFPVFRLRGDFVGLMTVAVAYIVSTLATNISWLGAANGLVAIPPPRVLGVQLISDSAILWLGLVLLVITLVIGRGICKTRFGRALVALREDELAARCVGIRPLRYKIAAYAIGGALAGVAGAYFAGLFGYVGPTSFDVTQSFLVAEAVILGGLGSMLGSVLGAAILVGIETLLISYVPQISGHQDLLVGVLVLAIILLRPQGLAGTPFMRKRT